MAKAYDGANAAFHMSGATLDPQAVTAALGIRPDESHRAGDRRKLKKRKIVAKDGAWSMKSRFHVKSPKLSEHLDWLFAKLEPKQRALRKLADGEVRAYIVCFSMGTASRGPRIPTYRERARRLGVQITVDHFQHD